MYQPTLHREDRLAVQHALIDAHPFGLLITTNAEGPVANGLPFVLLRAHSRLGTLKAHLARANAQWRGLDGQRALVVFQGPLAYVSPSLYATKAETGKVVPTWNYVMVQARGVARVHADPAWLDRQVNELTDRQEAGRALPWAVTDAPASYIQSQLRGIVGIEIAIATLDGKWKVNQDESEADRRSAAEGFLPRNPVMSALIRDAGKR